MTTRVVRESTPVGNYGTEVHHTEPATSNRGGCDSDWCREEHRWGQLTVTCSDRTRVDTREYNLLNLLSSVFSILPVPVQSDFAR